MATETRQVHLPPPGKHALFSKYVVLSVDSDGQDFHAAQLAKDRYPGLPVLEKIFRHHTKTAVGAMTGSNDPYGFMAAVRAAVIVDELADLLATFQRTPFKTKIALENALPSVAAWVGEGLPALTYKSTTKLITVDFAKVVVLAVITRELATHGTATEATVLRLLRDKVSRYLATALFDPTIAAVANVNPASLTYGANSTISTGSSSAQIVTDVTSMPAKLQTPCSAGRWCMRPLTFARVVSAFGAVGLTVTKDNLIGFPVTLLSGMPKSIVFLDTDGILYASDDQMSVSVTTEASVEMVDSSSQSGLTGTGASLTSLFQCGLVGLKVEAAMSWAHGFYSIGSPTVAAAATYMTTTY